MPFKAEVEHILANVMRMCIVFFFGYDPGRIDNHKIELRNHGMRDSSLTHIKRLSSEVPGCLGFAWLCDYTSNEELENGEAAHITQTQPKTNGIYTENRKRVFPARRRRPAK